MDNFGAFDGRYAHMTRRRLATCVHCRIVQPDPRPMLDHRREHIPCLLKVATGIEHVVDLRPVLAPLFDLVVVAVVSD